MKRLLPAVVLGAIVACATGCDVSPPAATVNGVTISQSTLTDQLSSEVADTAALCAAQVQGGLTTPAVGVGTMDDGTTPNAVTPSFTDQELFTLILQQLEEQTLARSGVAVTHAELAYATADYQVQLGSQLQQAQSQNTAPSGCPLTTSSPLSGQLPAAFLRERAASLADQEMFEVAAGHVDVTPAVLRSYYASHLAQAILECLNVIVTDTQGAAQTLHDEIAAGTSFATASTSAGADQQASPPGGTLKCEYPSQVTAQLGTTLAATVDALRAGQLAQPLALQAQSSTGATTTYYLVVQMRQHLLVPFATLQGSIRRVILQQHSASVSVLLERLVARAHVTVDPRYGAWNPKRGVTVPTPPPAAFVPNPTVDVPVKPLLSLPGLNINPSSG